MKDIIQLLPDSVANQIAAGEVIQRPASVVKELVENAIDAGATRIDVIVQDAGKTLIQVIDDGKGMSETDARMAFERHATSKIRKADDLFALHTMGFRGEALASIAAVAQVILKTRQEGETVGTQIMVSGTKFGMPEPCACAKGCNFSVENLFFNVPARRKFLKSNSTEMNNIISALQRIALVYPEIEFSLVSNGVETYQLRSAGLKQRIVDIFGKRINSLLLPLKAETTLCTISGFVGKPESAKRKGAQQYFFVNGRYMRHAYFHKAVQMAYDRLVHEGEQVPYFIYFDVKPEDIDVNIHPTKTEIKFENEQPIWQILTAAVKESVGMFSEIPTIDFDTEDRPEIPVFGNELSGDMPSIDINTDYNPFAETVGMEHTAWTPEWRDDTAQGKRTVPTKWENLYKDLPTSDFQQNILLPEENTLRSQAESALPQDTSPHHYQYKGRYIMTAVKSGLMLIEQHLAHVRVLYEGYMKRMESHQFESQRLMFPETLELTAQEENMLQEVECELQEMGFELSNLGQRTYSLLSVPAGVEGVDHKELIHQMLENALSCTGKVSDDIRRELALSLARSAAIPVGQVLNNDEMEHLVNALFACEQVNHTPDGKKIIAIWDQGDIESMFR